MKRLSQRAFTFLLALFTLCSCLLPGLLPMQADAEEYVCTYVNTGNQRMDLINVGLTQIGFTEGTNNRTKYGSWYATPNQPWCATFVSWCIAQAQLPSNVVKQTCISDPTEEYFNIPYYDGAEYTPKPGDLFFSRIFGHVGIVYYVEGEYFYTIEGNTNVHDPDDPVVLEGLYVMTNRRRIKDYIFGVPKYQNDDGKDHTYKKCYESAHPHNVYYECTTCGDRYDTINTELVETCKKCIPCACYNTTSGYYLVDLPFDHLGMGDKHGESYRTPSTVPDNTVVYVYGFKDGWALINHDNVIGHLPSYYLKEYDPVPATPTVSADKTEYVQKDNATITWTKASGASSYQLRVFKDCTLLENKNMGTKRSYELTSLEPGKYEIQVYASNKVGSSEIARVQFVVKDVYRIKYDLQGGKNGPEMQTPIYGQVTTLSEVIPTRSGYTFLGWSTDSKDKFVDYQPGDSFISQNDVTLYAVWKANDATLKTLSIERLPAQTMYLKGDELNTTGLTLKLIYSDGSGELTTEGFTTEGFSSESLGTRTITVTYGGLTVTYDVQIMTYIPGDINLDRLVNRDDVMQLLWHISFPDRFPITVPADFVDDDVVNRDDVMQLLWHISFPDRFPLAIEPVEEPEEPTTETTTEPATESTTESTTEATTPPEETTEQTEEPVDGHTDTTAPEESSSESTETSSETDPPEEDPTETTEPPVE